MPLEKSTRKPAYSKNNEIILGVFCDSDPNGYSLDDYIRFLTETRDEIPAELRPFARVCVEPAKANKAKSKHAA